MSGVRVIAGSAKGKRLKTKQTGTLRPATDYVKEALFDILTRMIPESSFLDLFAGCGSIGIEALSRGAEKVVFVEKNPVHGSLIRENLAATGLANRGELLVMDVFRAIPLLSRRGERFSLAFVDPPFRHGLVVPTLTGLLRDRVVLPDGLIITRSATGEEFNFALAPEREKRYGDSILKFFRVGADLPPENRGDSQ